MFRTKRRTLLAVALALPFAARGQACAQPTPRDVEGPFYKVGAPMRGSLVEPGSKGERLELAGRVLTTQLYFPGEARGAEPSLVVKLHKSAGGARAAFDFVL